MSNSPAPRAQINTPGIPRLTFVVDDVANVLERLRAHSNGFHSRINIIIDIRQIWADNQSMSESVIIGLRAFLVVIFLGALLGQMVVVPGFASESAAAFPEVALLAMPYAFVAIVVIACMQVIVLAIWRLLTMVQHDAIFTGRAFRWVNVIIRSAAAATVLALLFGIHLLGVMRLGGPGVLFAVGAAAVCGTAFVLLMIVMRGLLHNATIMGNELAEFHHDAASLK
ncbi:MAG: DUF2975 domain-containing protein [Specibacter sp.]